MGRLEQVKTEPAKLAAMETEISIRRASANDAIETAAVFTAAFASMPFVPKIHSADEDRAFIAGLIQQAEVWLAIRDARVIGLACLDGDWLAQLYVRPDFHNRGAGAALLAHVKEERPGGFQLWTFQANTGARRFYERHGCVAVEFTDGVNNEEKTPDVRYAWRGAQ